MSSLASMQVRAATCRCGRVVLRGLDDEKCGMVASVEPYPVNALGEASALLAGSRTFEMRWLGQYELSGPRYAERIMAAPPGSDPRCEVMVEHQCERCEMPPEMRRNIHTTRKARNDDPNELPPF